MEQSKNDSNHQPGIMRIPTLHCIIRSPMKRAPSSSMSQPTCIWQGSGTESLATEQRPLQFWPEMPVVRQ